MTDKIDTETMGDLIRVAHLLADAARPATLEHFRSASLEADNKRPADFDPVTEGDRAAERAMRDVLAVERPDDAIIGEEFGTKEGTSGLTWVLDPIDGTRGYLSGTPTWGVLIAVGPQSGPVVGIIDQPYIGERFIGAPNHATVTGPHGTRPLQTRAARPLSQSILFTTFPEVGSDAERAAFNAVADQAQLVRYGCDCYAYALLAAGQIDLVIEAGLNSYDIQAPIALIQAAGGIVTDWDGNPVHNGGQVIAAANRAIHQKAMEILRSKMR